MNERTFKHHTPQGSQAERYELLRKKGEEFAQLTKELCPSSRESSLARTKIEEAVMWANKSIAVNE